MGKKIVHATIGLTGFAIGVGLISLCMNLHSLWWFAGPMALFKVETRALSVNVECARPMPKSVCEPFEGNPTLEDFAQRACAPTIQGVIANLCEGSYNAHVVGLMLVIVFVMNIILQGAAVYSFNYYMTSSMRKKYRKLGVILQSIGIFCVVAVLAIYYGLVIIYMNGVKFKVISDMPFMPSASHAAGATYGYIFMWVSCFLQVGAILLAVLGAGSSQEEMIEEAREQARFAAELGGVEMGNYGQQGMYPGMQPQMQPQMGMYQPGMGGFQQPVFQQPGFR